MAAEKKEDSADEKSSGDVNGVEPVGAGEDSLAGLRVHGLPNISSSREEDKEALKEEAGINIKTILENIDDENKKQAVKNLDKFGPVTNDTVVIIIQVHNREGYLRQLVNSLSAARHIENTLLVFSHDVWDEQINTLVRGIEFTKVVQMFYPFSLQTHPHSFPGESPKDCPRDADPKKARTLGCTNSKWPDIHGHYREAKFTQTKHHWWWKINRVFNGLKITKDFFGSVLFIEEDHYVATDFLHVLGLMKKEKAQLKQKVDIISLGTYLKRFNFRTHSKQDPRHMRREIFRQGDPRIIDRKSRESVRQRQSNGYRPPRKPLSIGDAPEVGLSDLSFARNSSSLSSKRGSAVRNLLWESPLSFVQDLFNKVEINEWISSKHNMGMAFTREVWNKIASCSSQFCEYDDYNWDWSLQHISHSCLKEKLQVMMVRGPRVFHIGECGVHHKKSDCDSSAALDKVTAIIRSALPYLFPERLTLVKTLTRKKVKLKKGNGGWGDKRDHQLCRNMTLSHNKEP